jgi:hypothetical protein
VLTEANVRGAASSAISFLSGVREPHALLFMGILHRRFGIEEFAVARERYDEVLPEHPDRAATLRVFRRMFDANNPLEPDDLEHVTTPTDRMLVSALYCDRLGLPPSFAEGLDRAVGEGGYLATHALLSWVWIQENRCGLEVPEGFIDRMCGAVAAIINENPRAVNDLKLEAGAFLCLARQSRWVDLGFVQRVFACQNADGGWGPPEASSWHSTILALMIVLHVNL